ncbi:uncharacterized protein LOC131665832 [Phymastichus coffea]|uniref:uncharacterized protein LOC131665832 n=1 Tax=Phymastichus coffea TaxID=108790 RepID=UPI00273C1E7A|nr:uncharacterized protein LOC131665832 [Phymastichus coffea]
MKSLFIIVLSIAVAEAQERQRCEPKTQFMQYCNTCFCDDGGFLMGCTLRACEPDVWNIDGTKKDQLTVSQHKNVAERSTTVWQKRCEPGKVFKYYCNFCTCSSVGKVGRCTRMLCNKNMYNEDGTLKIDDPARNAKQVKFPFKIIARSVLVTNMVPTRFVAMRDAPRIRSKMKVQRKARKKGHNVCIYFTIAKSTAYSLHADVACSIGGIANVTNIDIVHARDACVSGKTFYGSKCNRCVCTGNGKSAFCTLMSCQGSK